jgi:hypothetical protein
MAAVVSAAPTAWWLSVAATMRGPNTEPHLTDTLAYIALSAPFLVIPAAAFIGGLNLISSPDRQQRQKASLFTVWVWVLLLVNPIVYVLWLMHSLEGM